MASFEEYLRMQENLRKMVAPIQSAAIQNAALFPQIVDANSLASALEPALERYLQMFSESQSLLSDSLQESLSTLSRTMELVTQSFPTDILDSVSSSLEIAVSNVDWYSTLDPVVPVLEEELENEEESVKEISANIKARKPLTLKQLTNLFGVIITLIQILISVQPNRQEEKMIQQQAILIEQGNTQIEQNNKIIELLEKQSSAETQSDFEDLVENLIEAGNRVADEIRFLTEAELTDKRENPTDIIGDSIDVVDDSTGNFEDFIDPGVDQPETDGENEAHDGGVP